MIVLVDLEWLENSKEQRTPTQLAAIRVDDSWNVISTFNERCKPLDDSYYQWHHMAFAGGSAQDFLSAEPALVVFSSFYDWILPNDVILWWPPEPPEVFAEMMRSICSKELLNETHSVRTAFEYFVKDGKKTKGGVYHLASKRQIPLLEPEHCSLNDVNMMKALLQKVNFELEWLYRPVPQQETKQMRQACYHSQYQFYVDLDSHLAHIRECRDLKLRENVIGCATIDGCLKYKAEPCPACCKEKWEEHLIKRNEEVVKRTQCNYYYLKNSSVFHKPNCLILLNSTRVPRGTMYYETCVDTGRSPCEICNPKPSDVQSVGKRRYAKYTAVRTVKGAEVSFLKKPVPTIQKISMTMAEQQAMRRYRVAAKERKALNLSEMKGQAWSDAMTLTATRFAFWAVVGYSNFHIRSCPKLNGMSNIKGFSRFSEAVHAGYKPCRYCKPSKKYDAVVSIPIYNEERKNESVQEIIEYCGRLNIKCNYEAPMLIVETEVGHWRIDTSKRPIFIEHKHIGEMATSKSTLHWQPRMFLSMMDVIQYIVRHDIKQETKD